MRRNILYNKKLKNRARDLRKEQTPAENKIWYQYLSKCEYRFLRQRPIGNYIADFYCPKLKLIIEIDGDSHFTEDAIRYDEIRTAYFNGIDINVIRITNDEINGNFKGVCQMLEEKFASMSVENKDPL